ncbi:hypothetical protein [Sphingomonas sp. KR3-1]|uniref:hypothetical protein n=1 Tax=Sphingomonas sp. KR3-1 TaxID=3156611 RepID=UPI0032B3E3DB
MRSIPMAAAAALLASLAPALPVAAQTSIAPAPATIEVPFNPPLDTPLRYQVSTSRAARPGQPALALRWVEELRFTRVEGGFLAYWRMDWASLPPEMRSPAVAPMVKPLTGEPIALELDATGTVLRVHDWPAARAKILAAVEGTRPLVPAAVAAQVMPKVREMYEALTAETAVPMILKNLGPVFEFGGVSMAPGEVRSGQVEQPVSIGGGTVTANMSLTLSALEAGRTATFVSRREIDKESMQRLMERVIAQFGAADRAAAERQRVELAKTPMMMTDITTTVVDLSTGLPVRLDNATTGSDAPATPVKTLSLVWLR